MVESKLTSESVTALVKKQKKADKESESLRQDFLELGMSISEDLKIQWAEEEREALDERGDALNVYGIRLEKG